MQYNTGVMGGYGGEYDEQQNNFDNPKV